MSADEDLGFKWSKESAKSANRLSEEMVQSMAKIYCNLNGVSDGSLLLTGNHQSPTSHFVNLTPSSVLSVSESLMSDEVLTSDASSDLYKARGKLSWADVGPYKYACEVRWLSVGKEQLECAAHALGNFRLVFWFFLGGVVIPTLLCPMSLNNAVSLHLLPKRSVTELQIVGGATTRH
jgi:hypothetical protein